MATTPFPAAFVAALKRNNQGGKFSVIKAFIVNPLWFCCVSGLGDVGKDPVATVALSVEKECTGVPVSVDLSGCWAPSSTLSTYEVDWGDGNTSAGACPLGLCPPNVAHPGGGYALPGTYTITVTVTDNIGATGTAELQIEIVLCTNIYFDIFCSVIAGGVWYTGDGGNTWEERNGNDGVLHNVNVFDLKVSPYTKYQYPDYLQELWVTVRQHGLYTTLDGGYTWRHVTLTQPAGYFGSMWCYSVLPSKVDEYEVYALAENGAADRVWLFRSVDAGMSWTSIELSTQFLVLRMIPQEGWTHLLDMDAYGQYVYACTLDSVSLSPVVYRVNYDLSAAVVVIDRSAEVGTWGGVRCDYNVPGRVWFFGDFSGVTHGLDEKILLSEDFGINQVEVSPLTFKGDDNIVRPVMPSIYNLSNILALELTDLEIGTSVDSATTWTVTAGVLPFACHCGERDTFDDLWVYIGREDMNVAHLQVTPNLGTTWYEKSGGILPNDQSITSIQITNYYEV